MKPLFCSVFILLICSTDAYSYRRKCRTNHRPMPYPFPWYRTRMHVPYQHGNYPYPQGNSYNPQYNVMPYPPQPVFPPQPAPVDIRYINRDVQWYRVQPSDVRPFPPNPQPVNPIPIIDNNKGPGTTPDQKPVVPVIPDPVVIPDPGPGPDPSRVDSAGSVSSDVGTQVLRQNSPTNPDGVIFLSNFNGGFPILSEVADPSTLAQRKTCSLRDVASCKAGEQCVFTDYVKKVFYTCLDIPSVGCHCQAGCRFQDSFIPYGQSAIVDDCGSKCSCSNMYGTVSDQNTSVHAYSQLYSSVCSNTNVYAKSNLY